jgi:lipopolysaccharide/colanic/teichoic acid biosynthesis glycosyltransferase
MVIKLDSKGPIIYKQKRCGLNGRTFRIYKFRTMCNDAEKHTGPVWAGHSDSRVTRIGKYMRLLHIDEIPQLVNVLKGEMSLVGPRPERPEFVYSLHNVVPNYESRLAVKPGITGWAQIRNHYDTTIRDVKRKVRYDIFYIRNMCLAVDVKVIVQTVFVIIMGNSKDLAH